MIAGKNDAFHAKAIHPGITKLHTSSLVAEFPEVLWILLVGDLLFWLHYWKVNSVVPQLQTYILCLRIILAKVCRSAILSTLDF